MAVDAKMQELIDMQAPMPSLKKLHDTHVKRKNVKQM